MSDSFPYDQLPTVPDLSDQIERTTELIGRGGYGSVYKGRWRGAADNPTPVAVVIKILELVPLRDEAKRTKRFKQIMRELSLWCSIQHGNILPLLGIARINGDTNVPAFVCPWMENGNAKEFCSRNPRFPPMLILYDIINGLHYLHTSQPEIVHGDIKAVNVLINNRCEACLCDFGLSRFLTDETLWKTTATHAVGTVRWMAPELLDGDASTPTKESDVYAYAMTCYEILSGDVPFKSVSNDMSIPIKIMKGQRPHRIEIVHSDFMWGIMSRCWEQEPENRLRTEEVLGLLRPKVDWRGIEERHAAEKQIAEKEKTIARLESEMARLKDEKGTALYSVQHAAEKRIAEKEEMMARLESEMARLKEEQATVLSNVEHAAEKRNAEKEEIMARLESEIVRLKEEQATVLSSVEHAAEKRKHDLSATYQRQLEEIKQIKTTCRTSTGSEQILSALLPQINMDSISVTEVANLVIGLNAQIDQASSLLLDSLLYGETSRTGEEPEIVWDELDNYIGSWLCSNLKQRSKEFIVETDQTIMQITLQTGLVNACNRIINDWNPPFWIDGLVFSRIYSNIEKTSGPAAADAWRALSRNHMTILQSERKEASKKYLTQVFLKLITAVGVSLESGEMFLSQFKEEMEDMVQKAVRLHMTVREDVQSMELVTFTIPFDTPFDASEMMARDGYSSNGTVACTVEIGLCYRKRDESGKKKEVWEVMLKPRVVLADTLVLDGWAY